MIMHLHVYVLVLTSAYATTQQLNFMTSIECSHTVVTVNTSISSRVADDLLVIKKILLQYLQKWDRTCSVSLSLQLIRVVYLNCVSD